MSIALIIAITIVGYLALKAVERIGRERERHEIAEKLFNTAKKLSLQNNYSEVLEMLHFMEWNLGDKEWFENFLKTHRTITREKYEELLYLSSRE